MDNPEFMPPSEERKRALAALGPDMSARFGNREARAVALAALVEMGLQVPPGRWPRLLHWLRRWLARLNPWRSARVHDAPRH